MAPPSLQTYQQAANSIYEPQKAAEAATLATTEQTAINTLEAGKGQINTDYQTAINNLANTVLTETGKINQLYTERLGGNFSGLQGNDLGMMYSKANQQQATIESTRANKLAAISTEETNAQLTYNTNVNNLGAKYSSLENQYANTSYAAAVKQYDTTQYQQEELALRQESLNISASKASAGSAAANKQADMGTIGSFLNSKVGGDGHVSQQTWNAAMQQWTNAGYDPASFVTQYKQFINQRYTGYHGFS